MRRILLLLAITLFFGFTFGQCNVNVGNDMALGQSSSHTADYLLGSSITWTNTFTVHEMGLISINSGRNFKVAIYDDAGGNPGNLLTEGSGTTVVGVNIIDVPDVIMPPGTYYYMAVYETGASISKTNNTTATVWYISHTYSSSLPSSFGTPITYTGEEFSYYLIGTYSDATTDTQTACNSYQWIDGNTYTASNNSATHTLTNSAGCDSVVTLNLTLNNSNIGTDNLTACNSYQWIDGNTYTASNNTATHTLTNTTGCDSVVTLNLTINNSNMGTDNLTACNSYQWIDGNTYTASNNTATHTLTNTAGCDSVVTLNLTINNSNMGTDNLTACNSYQWIDGNTYTASNNSATHTLTNTAGCDSVVTLNLTINNSNIGTDTQTACDSYQWIDGITYTASNNSATHTISNTAGCDSVVTLNLTINSVNSGVIQNQNILTASQIGGAYQWVQCPSMSQLPGDTLQIFTATFNSDYAVIITYNGCIDTSACYTVNTVGIVKNNFGNDFKLYPNPTDGNFSIDLGNNYTSVNITMADINGKLIQSKQYKKCQLFNLTIEEPSGIYLLIIESKDKKAVIRLVKE